MAGSREWIGGYLAPPFFIDDRDEPYRVELATWIELPEGFVVGQEVNGPETAQGALGRTLRAALKQPLIGPRRRPEKIRVADASLAAEVRAVVGKTVPIEIAPTPELDDLLAAMLASMPQDESDESYFEGGRIPTARVAALFSAAARLYEVAPWKVALDGQVLRMDIPALGVEGACLSIIGNLGESLGVVIFPSFAGYDAFAELAEGRRLEPGPVDFGTELLALSFERGADLPAAMRREIANHGWSVVDANAYPRVDRRDRDGASRPLVERDLRIASACAATLSTFFLQHRALFEADEEPEPVCVSYTGDDALTVRFTLPYEAFELFDVGPPPSTPTSHKAGRNDPCPCGSGKKYKKCHLKIDEAERAPGSLISALHELDGRLVLDLVHFALREFGSEWQIHAEDFEDAVESMQLALPWSVFCFRVRGESVADAYLRKYGRRHSPAERAWLDAQRAAWLSVWEVLAVEPGKTLTLRDLLSHEERQVREVSASQSLVVRDALLARVVEHEGIALLCGMHPHALPPRDAADVLRRARGRLRRKGAVPAERLRDEPFGRYLIDRWEDAVAELQVRREAPLQLSNTDGDELLLTTDHFELSPGDRGEIEARLSRLDGAEPPDPGEGPSEYTFLRPGNRKNAPLENTVIGTARLSGTALQLETNSRARADALRERVEVACGDLIRHRAREYSDPLSPALQRAARERPLVEPPPEAQQLVLDFKERHYASWPDESIPALDGQTPREAVRTARGREAVDVLLKDMENHERRAEGSSAFDFSRLRKDLGLE